MQPRKCLVKDDLSDAAEPQVAGFDDEDEEAPENYFVTTKDSAGGIAEEIIFCHGGEEKPPGVQLLHPIQSFQFVHNGRNIDGFLSS